MFYNLLDLAGSEIVGSRISTAFISEEYEIDESMSSERSHLFINDRSFVLSFIEQSNVGLN